MAPLYPYRFLNHISFEDTEIPINRYLYKFENHRNEIRHLKLFEKDFLFRHMKILLDANDQQAYDLYSIPEAREYVFHRIIITHANQVMMFEGPVQGPYGNLTPAEIRRNKRFFYEYLNTWKNQVDNGEGPYFSIIKQEISKKIKSLKEWANSDRKRLKLLDKKIVFFYVCFFHIYYKVKQYYDDISVPFVIKKVGAFDVVFNIYSYVHILSRHYYPNMNKDIGISLNTKLDCLDLDYLPDEVFPLIEKSNTTCPLTCKTEYLLFSFGTDYYILWLKFKRLNETREDGFEIRSFYKCENQCDMDKVRMPGASICIINPVAH